MEAINFWPSPTRFLYIFVRFATCWSGFFFVHFVNLVSSFFFVFSSAEFGVVREVERNERSVLIEASSRRLFVG